MKNDSTLANKQERDEMLKLLNDNGFIETVDKVGNFTKGNPIYYKKIGLNKFLTFSIFYFNKKTFKTTFDFGKISAESEKAFLLRKCSNYEAVRDDFRLKRDFYLFDNELEELK